MNNSSKSVVVCGAGGFIGGHLVSFLLKQGFKKVRAVDIKPLNNWFQVHTEAENLILDLRGIDHCQKAVHECAWVFNLAADMGGIGYIERNKRLCMMSVLINTHLLLASTSAEVERFFFASSACVYNHERQDKPDSIALSESDAYPANPQDGYGWEKLFSERLCGHYSEETDLITRIARFHNTYGPFGEFQGGKEKAPASICRKIIEAKLSGNSDIEIWGSGEQERSFMYIDDCVEGIWRIMCSPDIDFPVNLGSAERVSINELVNLTEEIADTTVKRIYDLGASVGVMGRNSDNSLLRSHLDWEPTFPLAEGLKHTYSWIFEQILREV
jgi:GDP-D-mannose 3',5'-epimerase